VESSAIVYCCGWCVEEQRSSEMAVEYMQPAGSQRQSRDDFHCSIYVVQQLPGSLYDVRWSFRGLSLKGPLVD